MLPDDYLDESISQIAREEGKKPRRTQQKNKVIRQEFGHNGGNGSSEMGQFTMEDNRRSADRTNAPSALYSDQPSHAERRKESGSTVKFGTN